MTTSLKQILQSYAHDQNFSLQYLEAEEAVRKWFRPSISEIKDTIYQIHSAIHEHDEQEGLDELLLFLSTIPDVEEEHMLDFNEDDVSYIVNIFIQLKQVSDQTKAYIAQKTHSIIAKVLSSYSTPQAVVDDVLEDIREAVCSSLFGSSSSYSRSTFRDSLTERDLIQLQQAVIRGDDVLQSCLYAMERNSSFYQHLRAT